MHKTPLKLLSLVLFVLPCIAHAQVSVTLIIHNRTDAVGCDMDCTNPIYRCALNGDTACFGGNMTVGSNPTPGDYIYGLYTSDGYRVGREADYRVNADGTSGWVANDPGFGCVNALDGPATLSVHCNFAPTGSVHSEASAQANVDVVTVCDNRNVGDLTNINLPLSIGTTTRPEYAKPCDRKDGGDQCKSCGMARYSAHSMLASLNIEDTPIGYMPPRGPAINVTVTYNQRESQQPETFSYSNLGPKWTFNWLSYIKDDPNNASADATVFVPRGGTEAYSGFDSGSQSYSPDAQSHAVLVRTASTSYEKRFPDGSKQVFNLTDGATSYPRKIFMTQWVDPAGNAVTLSFDSSFRITEITDALGQVTTLSYELSSDPLKITKITEPFPTGRSATFTYTNGQLTTITDEIGIQSIFTYATDGTNFVTSLQTPYGTTNFSTGQSGTNKWVEMTDPLGGKERVEYRDNAPGISASDPAGSVPTGFTNSGLDVANTFYWDKKAIQMYPPVNGVYDYTKARITHWAKNSDGSVSGITASEKAPLENRFWYSYSGQSDTNHTGPIGNPSQVTRVLDDATAQLWQYQYNSIGKVTKATDPIGRVTSYVYDTNNIDLLTVYQKNPPGVSTDPSGAAADKIASYTYNSLHEPLTATDAAGKTTTYKYRLDGHGQLQSVQNARGETTTYSYGPATGVPTDYPASITSPTFNGSSAVTSFTYDSANRVRTVTSSPDNYTVTTEYDNLDRPTQISYPDGTNHQFQYSQDFGQGLKTILDLTKSKDRRNLWTTRHYNANRQMDSLTDPLTRQTLFGWCSCGSLASITDPRGKVTIFNRDLQSRVTSKQFADNTSTSYIYENATSRLQSMTDALNQRTNYQYFLDDNLQEISYTGASNATSAVSFTYDPNYNRIASMTDGTGVTNYSYYPVANPPALGADQLQGVDGPLLNDTISYSYDELGRVTNRSINGASNAVTWAFDSLGRTSSELNKLGTFIYAYDTVTNRLSKVTDPSGQSNLYTYFPNAQDRRLQEIKSLTGKKKLISQFDYTYDAEGQILNWTQDNPSLSRSQRYDFGYDNADQLLTAPLRDTSRKNTLIKQFTYAYDFGGNRTSEQVGSVITTAVPNDLNEIVSQSGGTNRTLTYDLNGNLINDGSSRTFEWDAANRLLAINYTGTSNRSEFTYDGLGRRVKIVEKNGSTVTSTKQVVWNGSSIAEERDANNNVTRRSYGQGEQISAASYFYTRDHLGSIRELTDGSGVVQARYDYDPYGRRTKVSGTLDGSFGFAGHYYHSASNLHLAPHRAYDASLGRWLSRDPIGEIGGVNLYLYAFDDPVDLLDTNGAFPNSWVPRYGYWGGPDWSGGWRPSQHGGRNGPLPPIDALDAAAMRHDLAYGRWGIQPGDPNSECWKINDLCARNRCYRKEVADNKLINDANALAGTLGLNADLYIYGINWVFNHPE